MPPPRIIEHPMDTTVPITKTAEFVCVGQGYGFVDAIWIRGKPHKRTPPPSKSIVTTMVTPDNITTFTSILTIPDLEDNDDNKNYRCMYNNSGGETRSNPARLTIESRCSYVHYDNVIDHFM